MINIIDYNFVYIFIIQYLELIISVILSLSYHPFIIIIIFYLKNVAFFHAKLSGRTFAPG